MKAMFTKCVTNTNTYPYPDYILEIAVVKPETTFQEFIVSCTNKDRNLAAITNISFKPTKTHIT
jgi:hypothetical protein